MQSIDRPAPQLLRAKVTVTAVFIAHGLVFSSWAAHIPHVKAALGLSDSALGTALFGAPLGSLAATLLSHWALPRWGSHRLIPVTVAGLTRSKPSFSSTACPLGPSRYATNASAAFSCGAWLRTVTV